MSVSPYTRRRRVLQYLAVALLACIPLRLVCFDLTTDTLRFFGKSIGLRHMFWPFMLAVGTVVLILYLSMKKGRIFCSHVCPMHLYLEHTNALRKNRRWTPTVLVAALYSLFLTQVVLSLFHPLSTQLRLVREGSLPLLGVGAALFIGLMILMAGYREVFCQKGCPYALIQMLLQSEQTRYMEFSNADKACTNCRRCDTSCPYELKPRFESKGDDCSNCNLCHEACAMELGEGKSLFTLVDPPDPEDAAEDEGGSASGRG